MSDRDPFTELEQLFDDFIQIGRPHAHRPGVDIVETDDAVVVHCDLPGRDSNAIDVALTDGRTLTVAAEARELDTSGEFVARERTHEPAERTVRLPAAVGEEDTEASYDDGVLTVTLPKLVEDSDGTEIPVN